VSLGPAASGGGVPRPAARGEGGRAAELATLHTRIEACTACPLHRTRCRAVPGDGPVTARILAVGEAPGETEDRTGRPFVGAAGQLLTRLLRSVGLEREDIYICNVLKCRPPGNRDPEPEEVSSCAHFLDEQVALIRPDAILLLGRHAVGRLLPGMPGIGRIHGQRVRRGDRVYVPLYHPAAALYNAQLLRTLEEDMQRVRGYLDEAEAERERRQREQIAEEARAVAIRTADEQLSLF
jgi:uracil-DNA glycosylase